MGQAGVTAALDVIRKELDITMALTGVQKASDIAGSNRKHILVPRDFEGDWV